MAKNPRPRAEVIFAERRETELRVNDRVWATLKPDYHRVDPFGDLPRGTRVQLIEQAEQKLIEEQRYRRIGSGVRATAQMAVCGLSALGLTFEAGNSDYSLKSKLLILVGAGATAVGAFRGAKRAGETMNDQTEDLVEFADQLREVRALVEHPSANISAEPVPEATS